MPAADLAPAGRGSRADVDREQRLIATRKAFAAEGVILHAAVPC
jgi:hypothetical protein